MKVYPLIFLSFYFHLMVNLRHILLINMNVYIVYYGLRLARDTPASVGSLPSLHKVFTGSQDVC